jgi:hypothetical protein
MNFIAYICYRPETFLILKSEIKTVFLSFTNFQSECCLKKLHFNYLHHD